MVQSNENESLVQTIKQEKETLLKKFDIPVGHLDFSYVETCSNGKELEQIFQILKSGEEGYYPQLLQFTEDRLREIYPKSKFLRKSIPILNKTDLTDAEWNNLSTDIQRWLEEIKTNDEELLSFKNIKSKTNEIPVREVKYLTKKGETKKKERIKSMDYNSWDKLDVDAEILKMDIADEKMKEASLKKAKEKEKLNTITLNVDLMTKAELVHAANEANKYGNENFRSGEYEDAFEYYSNSLLYQSTATAFNNRAITNIKLKKYQDALKDCSEVFKLDPTNEKAFLRKALALKCLERYDNASVCLENLIQINPNCTEAQSMLRQISNNNNSSKRSVRLMIQEESSQQIASTKDTSEEKEMKHSLSSARNYNKNDLKETLSPKKKKLNQPTTEKENLTLPHKTTCSSVKIADKYDRNNSEILNRIDNKQVTKNIIVPIPSTSKSNGPFYEVVNVPVNFENKKTKLYNSPVNNDDMETVLNKSFKYRNIDTFNQSENEKNIYGNIKNFQVREDDKENIQDMQMQNLVEIGFGSGEAQYNFDNENFTPFEFMKCWQSIKSDPSFLIHEKLLRLMKPDQFVPVVGKKMDGDMFVKLLKCLEIRFNKDQDADFIAKLLTELIRLPRIDIMILFLNNEEKFIIRNLIIFAKKHGNEISEKVCQKYSF